MSFDLGSAVLDVGINTGGLAGSIAAVKGMFAGLGASVGALLGPLAIIGIGAVGLSEIVTAATEGEEAAAGLASALKSQGQEVENNLESSKEFANQLMAITKHGDEATLGLITYGVNLGLTTQQAQDFTQASYGLSKALGMDATAAMKAITLESMGHKSALDKAIPSLKGVTDQEERLAIIQAEAAAGWQQEKDASLTFGGTLSKLGNSVGELAETLGGFLLPVLDRAAKSFTYISDQLNVGLGYISEYTAGWFEMLPTLEGFGEGLKAIFASMWSTLSPLFSAIGELLSAVFGPPLAAAGEAVSYLGDSALSALGSAFEWVSGTLQTFIEWLTQGISTIVDFGFRGDETFAMVGAASDGMVSVVSSGWEMLKGAATSTWGFIGPYIQSILAGIKETIGAVVFAFLNWDLSAKTIGLSIYQSFVNLGNQISAFWTNTVTIAKWAWDNLGDIAQTTLNYITTVFSNIGKNIVAIFSNLPGLISGSVSFSDLWTPLTDGFENEIKKWPDLITAQKAEFKDEWRAIDKEWDSRTKEWNDLWASNAPKPNEGTSAMAEAALPDNPIVIAKIKDSEEKEKKGDKKDEAGSFKSITQVWKDAQSALLKSQDKLPEQQLKAAEQQVVEQKKANEHLEKIAQKTTTAVWA